MNLPQIQIQCTEVSHASQDGRQAWELRLAQMILKKNASSGKCHNSAYFLTDAIFGPVVLLGKLVTVTDEKFASPHVQNGSQH